MSLYLRKLVAVAESRDFEALAGNFPGSFDLAAIRELQLRSSYSQLEVSVRIDGVCTAIYASTPARVFADVKLVACESDN
ncbi:hypothetical protein I6I57_16975 [Brevibacterium casei]|uniref:hypothetical protein n=1 Tax=Brevibacterium casei TaxID=33889 RepID=UPI00191A0969|nr:hypothetical protein [Brevibacterium casei]QQT69330.1 hypothetical protein I6I57_16975 [Brevibacterium casei]